MQQPMCSMGNKHLIGSIQSNRLRLGLYGVAFLMVSRPNKTPASNPEKIENHSRFYPPKCSFMPIRFIAKPFEISSLERHDQIVTAQVPLTSLDAANFRATEHPESSNSDEFEPESRGAESDVTKDFDPISLELLEFAINQIGRARSNPGLCACLGNPAATIG